MDTLAAQARALPKIEELKETTDYCTRLLSLSARQNEKDVSQNVEFKRALSDLAKKDAELKEKENEMKEKLREKDNELVQRMKMKDSEIAEMNEQIEGLESESEQKIAEINELKTKLTAMGDHLVKVNETMSVAAKKIEEDKKKCIPFFIIILFVILDMKF